MKTKILLVVLLVCCFTFCNAQNAKTFSGDFYNKENDIALHLNLMEESINVPGFSMLGPTNGYMNGNIYGTWIVTSFKIKNGAAVIRLSNDFGSDTQEIEFTQVKADTFSLKMQGPLVMRKVEKRKLVKIPLKYIFVKKHQY